MKKRSTAVVLMLFALWFLGFAYQVGRSTQHQEDRKKIEAAYKANKAIENQASTHDSHAGPSQPPQPQAREGSQEAPEITYLSIKLGEAVLALVTVWLVLVTRDLVIEARESSERLWKAGEKQRALSEDTAQRQLRAYVIVSGKDFGVHLGNFESTVRIKNVGQTPAYDLTAIVRTDILPYPLPDDFNFALQRNGIPSVDVLGPRQRVGNTSCFAEKDTTVEEWREARSEHGNLRIYTYGTVNYRDAFSDKVNRHTNFCYCFAWDAKRASIETYQTHNDAS
jgi:hypothetical protein